MTMNPSRTPLVLFRTSFFGTTPIDHIVGLEQEDHFTVDQSRLKEADVVVFHVPDLRLSDIGDTPKYSGQMWVAWSLESNVNYPRLAQSSFLRPFDLLMTYQRGSDVWVPYFPDLASWQRTLQSKMPLKTASSPVVMFQSSIIDKSGRCELAVELIRRIKIDSYGRYLRNKTLASADLGRQTKLETIADYHFCLALENSIAPDYVTEKLYDCLLAGVVPVYRGAPNVAELAPAGSYINADAYGGASGLASYLHHLLERPDEYAGYFAWRDKPLPEGLVAMLESTAVHPFIRLLNIASARIEQRTPVAWRVPAFPFGVRALVTSKRRRLAARKQS
jgi:hypothetical protein